MKEYSITSSSRKKYFDQILIKTFLGHFIPLILFFVLQNTLESKVAIITAIFFGWFCFFATPTILLFYNHLNRSRGKRIAIGNDSVKYYNGTNWISFTFDEISKLELKLSPPSYDKRVDFLFFGKYFYSSFHLIDGRVLNISCLMLDEVVDLFPTGLIKRKKKTFPLLPKVDIGCEP